MGPFEAKAFAPKIFEMEGISKKTTELHLKLYEGYVKKANEILEKLAGLDRDPAKANQTYSEIRVLKVELTFALGGIRNHELYFDHLGGSGGKPKGKLAEAIEKHFGSFDEWARDLAATGLAARGWVWLAYDYPTQSLFNFLGDAQNTFPVWHAEPILALDTYEHAYWLDFGTDRAAYIDTFMANLDWDRVAANFDKALTREK